MAVSACNDRGNLVAFDNEISCILSGRSPEVIEIRRLLKQAKQKILVQRTGGTFTFRMWRVPEGFPRQGKI